MRQIKGKVRIDESEWQSLAKAFDDAVLAALSKRFSGVYAEHGSGMPGACTLSRCKSAFRAIHESIHSWAIQNGVSLPELYSTIGTYTVEVCNSNYLVASRSMLRALFKRPENLKPVCAYLLNTRETVKRRKEVLKSILLSVQRVCGLTYRKNKDSKPSAIVETLIESGSLGRYLGGTISYHYAALIPNIREKIERFSLKQTDLNNVNKECLGDEYMVFCDKLPTYELEAEQACRCVGNNPILSMGVLHFTDDYYSKTYLPKLSTINNVEEPHIH